MRLIFFQRFYEKFKFCMILKYGNIKHYYGNIAVTSLWKCCGDIAMAVLQRHRYHNVAVTLLQQRFTVTLLKLTYGSSLNIPAYVTEMFLSKSFCLVGFPYHINIRFLAYTIANWHLINGT